MTDNFTTFVKAIQDHFYQIQINANTLYELDLVNVELWDRYLNAFPEGTNPIFRIRNTSLGTLLANLSEGMEVNEAVRKYEKLVAPENYKRPKPIYTTRRFATLDDISDSNILFVNRNATKRITDVFTEMAQEITVDPKKLTNLSAVTIEDFIANVLPSSTSVEVLLENRHRANLVSLLVTPANADAPSMFKWGNAFSWAYTGNITDPVVAEVEYSRENGFVLHDKLSPNSLQRTFWGLKSNQFVPVKAVMYSPNFWGTQMGRGNRHYFFMLEGCVNDERPNDFCNKMAVQDAKDQLSGIGFLSTKRNSVIVRVKGTANRMLNVMI